MLYAIKQALCSSLSKSQAINTFKSEWSWDCCAAACGLLWAAAAAEKAEVSFRRRRVSRLVIASVVHLDVRYSSLRLKITFWAKNENQTKQKNAFSAENETGINHQKSSCSPPKTKKKLKLGRSLPSLMTTKQLINIAALRNFRHITTQTRGSAMAEGLRDALVSRNSATTKYPYHMELFAWSHV